MTHAMRGPTYAILFLVTPNFEMRGGWAVAFAMLLVFDVGISVADFWLERKSREELGGLPSGEYVLHMIMAMLFGAFVMRLGPHLAEWAQEGTAMSASDQLAAPWVRVILGVFAAGVFGCGAMDFVAARKLSRMAGAA